MWRKTVDDFLAVKGLTIADIGCGGGIYTRAMLEMGAGHVFAIDASHTMLDGARSFLSDHKKVTFLEGEASTIPLEAEVANVVLERALIHHLQRSELRENVKELYRILQPGGFVLIQDRTLEDCFLPPDKEHVRGHFFTLFPELRKYEQVRRYNSDYVIRQLHGAGFFKIKVKKLMETRFLYPNHHELYKDLIQRRGRSILHELKDEELEHLASYIQDQYLPNESIIEKDRWTIWMAQKPR
ncbi:class I SAM-dependent methyltransferase [Pontibacillus salicampi]|uniref:Class I SAM-dependent methyltransferase n=1 Tax=Pontibacillus salicampi TaxID=1449801 RepID=A0ABV6LSS9_9BACI